MEHANQLEENKKYFFYEVTQRIYRARYISMLSVQQFNYFGLQKHNEITGNKFLSIVPAEMISKVESLLDIFYNTRLPDDVLNIIDSYID